VITRRRGPSPRHWNSVIVLILEQVIALIGPKDGDGAQGCYQRVRKLADGLVHYNNRCKRPIQHKEAKITQEHSRPRTKTRIMRKLHTYRPNLQQSTGQNQVKTEDNEW